MCEKCIDKENQIPYGLVEDEPKVCRDCGSTEDLTWGPDPYLEEIADDNSPRWMCPECLDRARLDI